MNALRLIFRVIDDDIEEPDAEIALVVLKDGERVSLGTIFYFIFKVPYFSVRFPINGASDLDTIEPLRKLIGQLGS